MAKKWDWYLGEAGELIQEYRKLREDQAELDRLMRLDWQLPKALAALEWMRPVRITAPYDAIRAGVRVLSVLEEAIEVDPITVSPNRDSEDAKKKANAWEDVLKWQFQLACRRRAILKEDITRSALAYDEVCGMVIHLPTQIKSIESLGGDAKRQKEALKQGQFAVSVKNPQTVFTRYSEYGIESVVNAVVMRPKAIVDLWGGAAADLKKAIDKKEAAPFYVLFDYYDRNDRAVWCLPGDNIKAASDNANADGLISVIKMEHDLPFIPWVCVVGGTNLDSKPENQRQPLLWGAMKAEQEAVANIIGSLTISDAIATASQPRLVKSGPTPDSIKIDYTEPGGEVEVPPAHEVSQLTQQPSNPALREAYDRFIADLSRSTIPQILVTAEAAPGEPFSGYNLRIQQAIASLMPWKKLSERFAEGMFRQMLLWAEDQEEAIKGPGNYEINPADIDPEHIYLSVEFTPYEPLDQQQKINSAVMASRELPLPASEILGMMNITNPQSMIRKWMKEQFMWAELQGQLQKISMEASGEIQQMAMQMAQGIVQEQMQAMQPQEQGPMNLPTPGAPTGMEGVEGPGFNPAAGGRVPAEAFPAGNVMEMQTGMTRGGSELV